MLGEVRIGLLGPILPYRGGIAQHTTMLHRELRKQCDLLTISFKRQYPGWLYPGKSDLDPGYSGYSEPGVLYTLDSLSPLSWFKTAKLFVKYNPRVVVIPWWTVFWVPCFGFIAKYLRRKGVQVLFFCHNVIEHESANWKTSLTKWVLSQGSFFIVHTKEDASNLKKLISNAKIIIHPHPIYEQFPAPKGVLARRARLELLFFGFVRPYKGLDILIEAMHLLKEEDIFLTIAGEWWKKNENLLKRLNDKEIKTKLEVVDRYVSEEEIAEYFDRADVVILPYRSATGSAIIPLAYHYGKPVIASKVGGLPDVVEDGISGRLVNPEDPEALAEAIRELLGQTSPNMRDGVKKVAQGMTFRSLAECILNIEKREKSR